MTILAFILELPESPRWLILKGNEDEALNVLGALSARPSDDPYVLSEFSAIKETVLEAREGGLWDLFSCDQNRHLHRTCLAYVNQMFQQITGINIITFYAASIFENQIKLSSFTSRIMTAALGTGEIWACYQHISDSASCIWGIVDQLKHFITRILPGFVDRRLHH